MTMFFRYVVSTKNGETKKGKIEAFDRKDAINKLLADGFLIISLKEKGERSNLLFYLKKVSDLEKMNLVKNMSLMLRAGLSLDAIVDSLRDQSQNSKLKEILNKTKEKIEKGLSLSSALSFYPETFSPLFLGFLKLGEESGNLDKTSEYLYSQLESKYEFKKKVGSALIYPLMVILVAFTTVISLFIFLLPKLSKLFSSLEMKLPLLTRILIWIINFFQENTRYLFTGFLTLIIIFSVLQKKRKIKKFFQKIFLGLPVFGRILKNINLAYLSKTIGLLIRSGMPIERTLEVTFEVTENEVYRERVNQICEEIKKGKKLSVAFEKHKKEFPKIFSTTVGAGEKTGKLDESLEYLASFYEVEVERQMKNLTIALEPFLLIIVGLVVGFIAIALISPIYQYISTLGEMR